jgi:glutamyl-tRNA reductase
VELILTGVHQRTAPVAVRERLAIGAPDLPKALVALRSYAAEGFILSTCNRVEVCAVATDAAHPERFLAEWHGLDVADIAPHLYVLRGVDAARHLFRLAAGLDSMVVGEDQIVAQMKDALLAAHAAGAIDGLLHRLLHAALATGKGVRTHTGIAAGRLSVVSVALDLVRHAYGELAGAKVLVVGAGRMAELTLKHLRHEDATLLIANRTLARAAELAAQYQATAVRMDELAAALGWCDVVVSATAAPGVVIDAELAARAMAGREGRSLLLLDLAVPRDVERGAGDVPGVTVYDVDDMQPICDANRAARAAEVTRAEVMVEDAVQKYLEWWASQQAVPTIRALRERAEAIRATELQRTLARCPELTDRERDAVQALSAAIINKLLHDPITAIKQPGTGEQLLHAARELFHLPEEVR